MKILKLMVIFLLSLNVFAQKYQANYQRSNFNPFMYKNKSRCEAGGILFKSPYYNVVQLYKNFELENPHCKKLKSKYSGDIKAHRKRVNYHAEYLSKIDNCPEVKSVSEKYLNNHERTMKSLEIDKAQLIASVKKEARSSQIQVESSYLAWGYIMCSSSHISTELVDRLDYLKELEEIRYETPPVNVTQNGETIKECHNVYASGTDDLEEFFVDITGATSSQGLVSYNTFAVPDNVIVESDKGEVLLESTCMGTNHNITKGISLDKDKFSKIKFKVDALCESKKGTTAWVIHFSCGEREDTSLPPEELARRRYCKDQTAGVISTIKDNVELNLATQQHQWMRAICQKKHYGKIVNDYTKFNTLLSPTASGDYKRLDLNVVGDFIGPAKELEFKNQLQQAFKEAPKTNSGFDISMSRKKRQIPLEPEDNPIDLELEKELAAIFSKAPKRNKNYKTKGFDESKRDIYELLDQEVPENESRALANVAPVTRHEVTPFVYGYDDFMKRKKFYCPEEPSRNDSLMQRVSYAYCHHAYPRLFGTEDDD